MKDPYKKIENGIIYYLCKNHDYLSASEFYESDLKNNRRTCKICTRARAEKSRQMSEEKKVLVRFRTWALRHGHAECKMWELSDVAPILGSTEELPKNIVLRPVNFSSPYYSPEQMQIVTMSDLKRFKVQHRDPHP